MYSAATRAVPSLAAWGPLSLSLPVRQVIQAALCSPLCLQEVALLGSRPPLR